MKMFFRWSCFLFLGLGLWSCTQESYEGVLKIEFLKVVMEDRIDPLGETFKTGMLKFSFIDGDGKIGASPQDEDKISRIHYTWYKRLPDSTDDDDDEA